MDELVGDWLKGHAGDEHTHKVIVRMTLEKDFKCYLRKHTNQTWDMIFKCS